MAGETAVDGDAEEALLGAEIFVAVATVATLPAADPRKYRFSGPDQFLLNVRPDFLDDTCDLMPKGKRQRHAAGGIQSLPATEIGPAVLDMQIGMAQPAALDAHQDLAALRLRRLDN